MRQLGFSILMLFLLGCSKNPNDFIPYVNGYWEIEEVTFPDGTKKIFKYNDTVEYIKISDSVRGIRIKLKPDMIGGFQTSEDAESFQLKIENDSLNAYYNTSFAKWKETILLASEEHLLVINHAKVRYLYKRYQPKNHSDEQTP